MASDGKGNGLKGVLGPLLLDAAVEAAKNRGPRIIAIGDVHGCVDELQLLLKRVNYQPGDAVVFLGDLVAKGPDSCGVVQMVSRPFIYQFIISQVRFDSTNRPSSWSHYVSLPFTDSLPACVACRRRRSARWECAATTSSR